MNVVIIHPVSDGALSQIVGTDPRIAVIDARGWFDDEMRGAWPRWTVNRYLEDRKAPVTSRAERDRVLAEAEVILGGWPYPLDLRVRAPNLRWFHQIPAGASNLRRGDLWGSDVMVTTSRGYGNTHPMAEYVLAGFLHFAKGLHRAYVDSGRHRFDHRPYRPILLQDKTVCVVGAGGIGGDVARLCRSVGMRVVGTRRRKPAAAERPPEFSRLEGAGHLHELLGESEFVAVCCQWTPETDRLIDGRAFAAMKPGTVLINVARGEIIDEDALIEALSGDRLRGVVLDVYVGEFEHEPDARLWNDPRVLITPHVSSYTDRSQHAGIDLFCDNLRAYLEGRPLVNVIDWERGY